MVIAINTRTISGDNATGRAWINLCCRVASDHPSHRFLFITAGENILLNKSKNTELLTVNQQSNNPILWKLWYNYRLPTLMRKSGVDVLLSFDGVAAGRTTIPQCLLVNDLQYLQPGGSAVKQYNGYIKTNFRSFLHKARRVIVAAESGELQLRETFEVTAEKITVLIPGAHAGYVPLKWEQREQVKEKYSKGHEYFLFSSLDGDQEQLINLLKAFSLFKKRQKSNMQLVIATADAKSRTVFSGSVRTYKFRSDVILLDDCSETEWQQVTAAAWCNIQLSCSVAAVCNQLNALQCAVPVIATDAAPAKEILGEAALYTAAASPPSIAEQLMLVYKDENKRNALLAKGLTQVNGYKEEKAAATLWQNLLVAAGK